MYIYILQWSHVFSVESFFFNIPISRNTWFVWVSLFVWRMNNSEGTELKPTEIYDQHEITKES